MNITENSELSAGKHTYASLKKYGLDRLRESGKSDGVVRNYLTAFNSWCKHLNLRPEDVAGSELNRDFDRSWTTVMDELQIAGNSSRTIQDRVELMLHWRSFFLAMGGMDTLPDSFHAALLEAMRRAEMTTGDLSRKTGIQAQRLRTWESGAFSPRGEGLADVEAIESVLRLPRGALTSRLGQAEARWASAREAHRNGEKPKTQFGKRMSSVGKDRLNYIIWPSGDLRSQWQQLIAFKSDALRDGATARNTWRIKPLGRSGARLSHANVLDGQVCASADAAWSFLGSYLGWLCLSRDKGGAGIEKPRVNSLAWILRHEKVFAYLSWRQRRAGGVIHNGIVQVLYTCCMLLRPTTGWVWLNSEVDAVMQPDDRFVKNAQMDVEGEWRSRCEDAYGQYRLRADKLSEKGVQKKSRDPREPIRDVLTERRPLQPVVQMIAKLESMPPRASAKVARAVWTRDVLLLKMLATNPLRIAHFAIMRYSNDNLGNFYRRSDGSWALRFSAADFKNEKGAAHEDYDAQIPESLWPDIERYLAEGRPHLAHASSAFFFLRASVGQRPLPDSEFGGTKERDGMWRSENIAHRISFLTALLRPGQPPFRGHAFRHIVATDFLKRHPGAYAHVARLLHDKLSTVLAEYGHLEVQDGLDRHFQSFASEWSALAN